LAEDIWYKIATKAVHGIVVALTPVIVVLGVAVGCGTCVLGLFPPLRVCLLLVLSIPWGMLVGLLTLSSRLWSRIPIMRPILLLPGLVLVAIGLLYLGLTMSLDEQDGREAKLLMIATWPMSPFGGEAEG